jgi:hypothetical protein
MVQASDIRRRKAHFSASLRGRLRTDDPHGPAVSYISDLVPDPASFGVAATIEGAHGTHGQRADLPIRSGSAGADVGTRRPRRTIRLPDEP